MRKTLLYIHALGDLFLPRACLACGRRLGMRERHLCLSCAADVPYTRFWLQPHNPLADRFNAVLERHRGTEPMDYAYAVALMYYKGAYRAIPRALKYHGDLAAGRHFGALLGRRLAAAPHFSDIDLVIPVPLHWTRRRTRGYNQATLLAQSIVEAFRATKSPVARAGQDDPGSPVTASNDALKSPHTAVQSDPGHPVAADYGAPTPVTTKSTATPGTAVCLPICRTDLLVRARRTHTQTRLSVEQKALNVASAFLVPARSPYLSRLVKRSSNWLRNLDWLKNFTKFRNRPTTRHSGLAPESPQTTRHSGLDPGLPQTTRHFGLDPELPQTTRHSGLDPESPRAILASARHILLVDDTFTTGATLYACYAALRPYTAARISIATLAAIEGTPSGGP